jgi:L,D-transpeptidase ErfK/SrfK
MRRFVLVLLGLAAIVTTARADYPEETFLARQDVSFTIPTPSSGSLPPIIGSLRLYRIRKGDTLMDVARLYGLGYNEIVDANPGLDPWVPPAGATVLLPTEWILPCCTYQGIVVNVPEMRLFYYTPAGPGQTLVHTYPVGLGRDDWQTPSGNFKVIGKTVNPQWNIPEDIRVEHIRERGDDRTFIPGGDPDNPLGKYRLELSMPMYRIHGTNIPWGVGMQVSHGCVRLYPEDIERLFPQVPVGTAGVFAYETVKVGRRGGAVYVESHEDIYGKTPAIFSTALNELSRRGVGGDVDREKLEIGLRDSGGVPFVVSGSDEDNPTRTSSACHDGASSTDRCQARDC